MISRERYLKLREMTRRYEAARKKFDPKRYQRGGGYDVKDRTIISAMAGHRDTTNEEKSQIEDFEWRMYPPSRAFGYYDAAMTKITGFMGNVLGRIIWKGSVTRAFGGKRQNITIVGTNNVMYAGVCNLTGGTYCRLKRIKGRGPSTLPNAKKRRVRKNMDDRERELWVRNDEGLYRDWRRSRLSMREYIKQNRAMLTEAIEAVLNRKPRQSYNRHHRNPKSKSLGAYVRVTMTAQDVAAFKRRWPASGLPDRAIWFEFERKNGDLVDISPGSERYDGPALAALSQDAQKFAGL